MGLDTEPGNYHSSYTRFVEMKRQLVESNGYIVLDWGQVTQENLMGEWEKIPEDPLLILFFHHDHTGVIKYEHTLLLANRIFNAKKNLAKLEWLELSSDFEQALRVANQEGVDLQFC